jgi:hypothetical protein
MIGVNWSKDSRSDPAATKEQFCPILLDFSVALRRAEMRRGPFVGIRQPTNVTPQCYCVRLSDWLAQLRSA